MPKLTLMSCLLLATAIVCQAKWLGCCSRSASLVANAATNAEVDRAEAVEQAKSLIASNRYYPAFGLVAAVTGVAVGLAAGCRHERGASVPVALLILYLLLIFVIV